MKGKSYTSTPPLGLHGLLRVNFTFTFTCTCTFTAEERQKTDTEETVCQVKHASGKWSAQRISEIRQGTIVHKMGSKCPTWHPETNQHNCWPANCNTSQKTPNLLLSVITYDESWMKVTTKDILQSTFIWKSEADTILLSQKASSFSKRHLLRILWMESTMPKHQNCFLKCTFQHETWVPNKTVVFIPRQSMAMQNAKLALWTSANINRTRVGFLPYRPDLTTCDLWVFLITWQRISRCAKNQL